MRELTLLEDKAKGKSIALKVLRSAQDESPEVNSGGFRTVPSLQHLLDVISSIIAEEYIMIAKQNPGVFLNNTPRLSARPNWMGRHPPLGGELRGCAPSGQGGKK